MSFESKKRVGIRGLNVIKLDGMMTCCGEEALVRGDAESIDL
jgi:hypothetical protein